MPLFSDQSISFAQIYITFASLHFSDEYSQLIFMFWRSYVPISALLPYVVSISVTLFSLRFGSYFFFIHSSSIYNWSIIFVFSHTLTRVGRHTIFDV